MSSVSFISEDYVLKHYTHEIEIFFKIKYKDYLTQYKTIQQDPTIDPIEKIHLLRKLSWKTFNLRLMITIYLNMLKGNRIWSSFYIHHLIFQLEEMLTPSMREKHRLLLGRHEQILVRLLSRIREKIYVDLNQNIYIFYNGV